MVNITRQRRSAIYQRFRLNVNNTDCAVTQPNRNHNIDWTNQVCYYSSAFLAFTLIGVNWCVTHSLALHNSVIKFIKSTEMQDRKMEDQKRTKLWKMHDCKSTTKIH